MNPEKSVLIYIFVYFSDFLPSTFFKMSWQSYVDDQLIATKVIKDAIICGHDGNVWATSPGLSATPAELKTIITNLGNSEALVNGVTLAGIKYMYLSGNEKVIRARKGTSGIHVMKTVQAVIVCRYEEPIVAEQAATVTEKLGDYLISVGY
ncbi:profilin [Eurytemora carolleeae]|uniref:profilin n=1 Tax=Eurytemora carolleeae TaxID=1294199 RepID=UPI000C77F6F7|nr:profilin [Eurytemora carolleeae]|eukprot:XP_023329744.1 profilin-like [Eurytemora affinis]